MVPAMVLAVHLCVRTAHCSSSIGVDLASGLEVAERLHTAAGQAASSGVPITISLGVSGEHVDYDHCSRPPTRP